MGGALGGRGPRWAWPEQAPPQVGGASAARGPGAVSLFWVGLGVGGAAARAAGAGGGSGARPGRGASGGRDPGPFSRRAPRGPAGVAGVARGGRACGPSGSPRWRAACPSEVGQRLRKRRARTARGRAAASPPTQSQELGIPRKNRSGFSLYGESNPARRGGQPLGVRGKGPRSGGSAGCRARSRRPKSGWPGRALATPAPPRDELAAGNAGCCPRRQWITRVFRRAVNVLFAQK